MNLKWYATYMNVFVVTKYIVDCPSWLRRSVSKKDRFGLDDEKIVENEESIMLTWYQNLYDVVGMIVMSTLLSLYS